MHLVNDADSICVLPYNSNKGIWFLILIKCIAYIWQVAPYLETANQDSVILILWYQDHDYPILEVFEKQTQDLREQVYAKMGITKSGWFWCGLEV